MTLYMLSNVLCSACGDRWFGAQAEEPGDPPRLAGFECPRCHEPAGRIDSRRIKFATAEAAQRYVDTLAESDDTDDSA